MDKMKMHTPNKADENFEKLAQMFPNAVTETIDDATGEVVRAIDKDVLMQEINTHVVEGREERYQFTWPDKKKSILLANAPINKTLRPCREESVDFDNTENLYIEGDNLEVLKLLQETYLGKIKMIYIDPPYNTGNDFVYEDNFAQSTDEYMENSGQFDEEGNRLVKNLDSNGRFHTDWLNMIYPRLKLAKDLLSDDGAIFISIDDNEVANLKKICNEIFGSDNFIAQAIVQKSTNGMGDKKGFAKNHEFILCYQKSTSTIFYGLSPDAEYIKSFNLEDDNGKYKIDGILMKKGAGSRREDSPTLYFPVYYNKNSGHVYLNKQDELVEKYPIKSDGSEGRWTWSKEKIQADNYKLYASPNGTIYIKDYLTNDRRMKIKTILTNKKYLTDRATNEIKEIFNGKPFDTPKPIELIKHLIDVITKNDDIVLDFFSGSATTAHAVMQLNAEDGGNRKFIMVQLPELTDEKSEAYKAGYKNICEIGKERIRRAGAKIKEQNDKLKNTIYLKNNDDINLFTKAANKGIKEIDKIKDSFSKIDESRDLDLGFRVLKCDSSNMKDVYYNPNDYTASLFDTLEDNIKDDRTPEDLLFQVMLDLGVLLSSKIEETVIGGKKVFNVADNYLIACFDSNVTDETITQIAKKKPYYFVMRDSSMANDSVATNFEQIFATYSPDTIRKVL